MSDVQEKLAAATEMDQGEENRKVGKMKFTPPVLHKYGEVVKICQTGPVNQAEDFPTYGNAS